MVKRSTLLWFVFLIVWPARLIAGEDRGRPTCDYCRMIVSDARYAAAAITSTGRTVRFDSVECLASWVATQEEAPRDMWVTDVTTPGVLIPVGSAVFHRDPAKGSPMGRGWQASAASGAPAGAIGWDALLAEVRVEMQSTPALQEQH